MLCFARVFVRAHLKIDMKSAALIRISTFNNENIILKLSTLTLYSMECLDGAVGVTPPANSANEMSQITNCVTLWDSFSYSPPLHANTLSYPRPP